MPTYFDPITLEKTEINKDTFIYLVKISPNIFAIKAINANPQQLSKCPTTNADHYWPVNTETLFATQASNSVFFYADQLTTSLLTVENVKEFLGIDPSHIPSTSFNSLLGQQFAREWADNMLRNLQEQSMRQTNIIFFKKIHSLYLLNGW